MTIRDAGRRIALLPETRKRLKDWAYGLGDLTYDDAINRALDLLRKDGETELTAGQRCADPKLEELESNAPSV